MVATTARAASMTLRGILTPGSTLGRYELLMPIAQGGMAAVWAARQSGSRGFEKTVAIKTMLPKLSDDPMFERMFLNEAALATRIQHPNVAQILDLGEEGDLLYIAMEWVDGEALSTLIRAANHAQEAVPRDLAVGIIERACWGLHAAHEVTNENDENAGLVHRDVSPQNILVAFNGAVKVVDFGVAKAAGIAGGETQTGSLKGKVPFMSPEQASGLPLDRRTDIFAIGILLYKLVTGNHPFIGQHDLQTLHNIIHEYPLRPRELDSTISDELEAIMMRCLAKDPEQRYATMADVAQALSASAGRVTEHEISSYMKRLLGTRGAERRASLKNAARSLGWALGSSVELPQMPHGLTPSTNAPSQRAFVPGSHSGLSTPSQAHSSRSHGSGHGPSSPTFVAVEAQGTHQGTKASTISAIIIALAGLTALAAIVALVIVLRRPVPAPTVAATQSTAATTPPLAPTTTASLAGEPRPGDRVEPAPATTTTATTSASAALAPSATTKISSGAGTPQPHTTAKPRSTSTPSTGTGEIDMGF